MAYRPHGHAYANPSAPSAWGRCDRCGFIYLHRDLQFQFDYRGPRLANLRILVCEKCLDKPQPQLKPILMTQDPLPVINARPENYNYANSSNISEPGSTINYPTGIPVLADMELVTEDGNNLTDQPIGKPANLDPNALMPLINQVQYTILLPVLSVTGNNTPIVTVSCSSPHGLSTNDQISVSGLTNNDAIGMYSVTVISATVFTYQTNNVIPSGGLLGSNARILTASVGIPPQYTQIVQVGANG
jgi:hypothetical protein